jgi:penicillin-binding protein 2
VRDPLLDIAGKTGTAQNGLRAKGEGSAFRDRDHAWFAAFAPSKAPEIAVVVLLEHGGSGPTQAAPVALSIIRDYGKLASSRAPQKKGP